MLEEHRAKCGYEVIFFPKYHPGLNFIEQCWGYAKCIYRLFSASSSGEDLERNLLAALEKQFLSNQCAVLRLVPRDLPTHTSTD
jgi:transposase